MNQSQQSQPQTVSGVRVPGALVQHSFDWQVSSVIVGTEVWIGTATNRVQAADGSRPAALSLNENITINTLAVSPSFPPGLGFGLSPNHRSRSTSGQDVLFVSSTRPAFINRWIVPTFGFTLVTIETNGSAASRVNGGLHYGNPASVTATAASMW